MLAMHVHASNSISNIIVRTFSLCLTVAVYSQSIVWLAVMSKRNAPFDDKNSRSRLCSLGRASYVSQSGMEKLLKSVREDGLPASFSRATQYRARKDCCYSGTAYGSILTIKRISDIDIAFQNPAAFLAYSCEHSPCFASIVSSAFDRHPCTPSSPWTVILYQDGIDFGDGLAKNKSRHSVAFYWSVLEFGATALAHEEVWGTNCVVRTSVAKAIPGAIAGLASHAIECFHNERHDMRVTGATVLLPTGPRRILTQVKLFLADSPALKEMIECKGHAGTKCCPLCLNATHHKPPHGAIPMHTISPYCVPITEPDFSKFKLHTSNIDI